MRIHFKTRIIKIIIGIIASFALFGQAFPITLQWGSVEDEQVKGYIVYYGTESGSYTSSIDVGNVKSYTVTDLNDGITYYISVSSYDSWGNVSESAPEITWKSSQTAKTTGIKKDDTHPGNFSLDQNYPNPFNPTTTISYTLSKPGRVNLTIYNVYGRKVKILIDEDIRTTGIKHEIVWDSTDERGDSISSGVYMYSLIVNGEIGTKRMIFNK